MELKERVGNNVGMDWIFFRELENRKRAGLQHLLIALVKVIPHILKCWFILMRTLALC